MADAENPETRAFLSQMLWRHELRAEPIVALLGPRGTGKSTTLGAISQECGGTVIHASIDFGSHDLDPVQAAAFISFELMRSWRTTRRNPVFHRFALGLLARNEPLAPSRPLARRQVRALIRQYVRDTPEGEAARQVAAVTSTSLEVAVKSLSHLAGPPLSPTVLAGIRSDAKPVIGSLLQSAARLAVRGALKYYCEIPEAESAPTYDSLIQLSRADPARAVKILMKALLADMAWHAARHPQLHARCRCITPEGQPPGRRHAHAWVLLVDGAETETGREFLTGLAEARSERIQAGEFDPLLVVASCGQWDPRWHERWCEPWNALPRPWLAQQRIPLFSHATHDQWASGSLTALVNGDVAAAWFPVWLDPLNPKRAARILAPGAASLGLPGLAGLAHRLTGGHPGAVLALRDQLTAASSGSAVNVTVPGALLAAEAPARAPLWQRWAEASLSSELLSPVAPSWAIPRAAVAAAYLADRRAAMDEEIPGEVPDLQGILDLLRQHLWITAAPVPSRIRSVTVECADEPATLHPWLARCLLAAAATTSCIPGHEGTSTSVGPAGLVWGELFTLLARDSATSRKTLQKGYAIQPTDRALFYELALQESLPGQDAQPSGGFQAVVAALAGSFNAEDHRTWLSRLDYITSAPSRLPLCQPTEAAYAGLIAGHEGCAFVEVATAKLVALLWLYRDPLTEHTARWDHEIHDSFDRLRSHSTRADTSALKEAALCFPPQSTHLGRRPHR